MSITMSITMSVTNSTLITNCAILLCWKLQGTVACIVHVHVTLVYNVLYTCTLELLYYTCISTYNIGTIYGDHKIE